MTADHDKHCPMVTKAVHAGPERGIMARRWGGVDLAAQPAWNVNIRQTRYQPLTLRGRNRDCEATESTSQDIPTTKSERMKLLMIVWVFCKQLGGKRTIMIYLGGPS